MTKCHIPYLLLTTAPAIEPLTLAETKLYIRVDGTQDDAVITRLITVVRQSAEKYMRRSLITQTWKLSYDDYAPSEVPLPKGPVQSITSAKIIAKDSSETVIAANTYYFNAAKDKLIFSAAPIGHAIEILYVTGFGSLASDVPDDIKQGMLSHIAGLYERRSDHMQPANLSLQQTSRSLYDSYRVVKL